MDRERTNIVQKLFTDREIHWTGISALIKSEVDEQSTPRDKEDGNSQTNLNETYFFRRRPRSSGGQR